MKMLLPAFLVVAILLIARAADDGQAVTLNAKRVGQALEVLGNPLSKEEAVKLQGGKVDQVEAVLDPRCLAVVTINPESRVKAVAGAAKPVLVEAGWSVFLIKVINEAGVTAPLRVGSAQAAPLAGSQESELEDRWLDLAMFRGRPLAPTLSGASIDYRVIQLYSRDAGRRAAVLTFDVGQGTQDLGFRSDLLVNFDCRPSRDLTLWVPSKRSPVFASIKGSDVSGWRFQRSLADPLSQHPPVGQETGCGGRPRAFGLGAGK